MRIKSHGASTPIFLYIFAFAAGGPMALFIYLKSADGPISTFVWLFSVPFFLLSFGLAFLATRTLIRLIRFGRWQLELPDAGGVIGEPLPVKLFPSRLTSPAGELTCHLRSVLTHSMRSSPGTRSSGGRTSESETLWKTSWPLRVASIHPRMGIDITLPFPAEGQGTVDAPGAYGTSARWEFSVDIPADGITHDFSFLIPVRGTGQSTGATDLESELMRRAMAANEKPHEPTRPQG